MDERKKKNIICIILAVLVIVAAGFAVYYGKKEGYETDTKKMVEKAESFWEAGDKNKAINQMWMYLDNRSSDAEAWNKLISYYDEMGDEDDVLSSKKKMLKSCNTLKAEENQLVLNIANRTDYVDKEVLNYNVSITAQYCDTDETTVTVFSDNLFDNAPVEGKVDGKLETLKTTDGNYLTTNWFPVDSEKENLSLSGNFNTSMWQFKDEDGKITNVTIDDNLFHNAENNTVYNYFYSTVSIPKGTCYVRVTYMNMDTFNETSGNNLPTYITYGSNSMWAATNTKTVITLPALKKGESITYNSSENIWKKITDAGEETLNIQSGLNLLKGDTLLVEGELPSEVKIDYSANESEIVTDGEYGVRFDRNSADPYCERVGDAAGLSNGYYAGSTWIGNKDVNDFDSISPWKDMKLCTIDASGNVNYDVDNNENKNDVMVEIPKFYYKREIIDNYEYIWISATAREGYQVEPAFVTSEGEKDHIYVGAYLSGLDENNNIVSIENTYPLINLSLNSVNALMNAKGQNYHELDYVTLSMLQRLYLVETACKNSQAIGSGATSLSFGKYVSSTTSAGAVNYIDISGSQGVNNVYAGDSVYVFDTENIDDYYTALSQYDPFNKSTNRTVTEVTSIQDGGYRIYFSGDPVQITQDKTIITHTPYINGGSDTINYHTGRLYSKIYGMESIKYRNIENLWGSVNVLLDNTSVRNSRIFVGFPDGSVNYTSYSLPATAESASPTANSVFSLGYDATAPSVMLPDAVGNGASSNSGFCDAVLYSLSEESYVLTYGLKWDTKQYAGLFAYQASFTADQASITAGSRMIYR